MSSEAIIHLGRSDAIEDLERQRGELRGGAAERLVVYCSEVRSQDPTRWEDAAEAALFLRTPAGDASGEEIRSAIHHAVAEVGVEEVICIAHTGCAHAPNRMESAASVKGATFMERVQLGARRHRQDVEEAKDHVRKCVASVESQVGPDVRVTGVVEIGEGGAMLGYVPKDDAFVPIV